ncbi:MULTISPECIES: PEP-CTERM sorting domain-containing protein [Calothrix]|uniref:PEP-CTERM sorting domain-containing protein n=2 Tax=Calothrix TaxID=1186 RepID=A0ABR8A394_9CYAN|nr:MULTISPECIES: PEP-CTERM sorting domain-containing protein [Calothrix]MBD2193930.1 PEP-CTERM sorting domain-containing protein [Calothrix parietina FACHB-288]MBD2222937.1 PEP-CTERM sorting domain-containing protein [Calothrix anomala FACHB-343]
MNFKTISIGIAVTCSAFAVGSTFGVSPAQAAFLNIVGTSDFLNGGQKSPTTDTIFFKNSKVESFGGALFSGLTLNSQVNVSSVKLTNPTNITTLGSRTIADYTGTSSNPFITFTSDPALSFKINNPFEATRTRNSARNTTRAGFDFLGAFYKNGKYVSTGVLTANEISGKPGSYSMTINVPEPLTILGSVTALGMGVALKKKQVQNLAKKKVTA